MSLINDKETTLMEKAQQGDTDAFQELIKSHKNSIYNLTLKLTGNYSEASDLVQDVFVHAFKSLKSFHCKSSLSTWLYRITRNLYIDKVRKKNSGKTVSIDYANESKTEIQYADKSPSLEQLYEAGELKDKLQKVLGQINPDQKIVILLRYIESKSLEEIADICNSSVKTVSSRIYRGLCELRNILGRMKK